MGNQGMTNWKFSAFFVISLMLITGLFSNAAIAASGDGTATLTTGTPSAGAENTDGTSFIPAGKKNYKMEFTYILEVDDRAGMAGGEVQIKFPTGWSTSTAGEEFAPQAFANYADGAAPSLGTDLLEKTRFSGSSVIIPLTKDTDDNPVARLDITFGVNVPTARGAHEFTVFSKSKNGRFTKLDDTTGHKLNVRVGPRDSITITPARVLGNMTVPLTIEYDIGALPTDVNVEVEINIPRGWSFADDQALTGWVRSDNGRMLKSEAAFTADSNVTVNLMSPNLAGSYEFTTKSKSTGGSLVKLDDHDGDLTAVTDPQPDIMVGNIAPAMGTVAITPSKPVRDDKNVEFKVTFTAAGRMVTDTLDDLTRYSDRAGIQIQFPVEIARTNIKSVTGGGVAFKSGATVGADDDVTVVDNNVSITISHLSKGQTIVLTTNPIDIAVAAAHEAPNPGTAADADRKSSFGVGVATSISIDGIEDAAPLSYALEDAGLTNAGDDAQITGGLLQPVEDPGELTISPTVLERGDRGGSSEPGKTITITYKALRTHNRNDIVRILLPDVEGIKQGVSKTASGTAILIHDVDANPTEIRWDIPSILYRDSALKVEVKIFVPDSTEDLAFNYATGAEGAPVSSSPVMIPVVGKAGDVKVEIVDLSNDNPIDPSFPAASKQEIGIRFTAENTTIQENGYFKVTVPSNWSRTTTGNGVAQVKMSDLTGEGIRGDLPKTALSASGKTITVKIDDSTTTYSLAKGGSITVQYGVDPDGDKDYRAVMPSVAGEQMITAKFKAYKSYSEYTLTPITATVTRVEDGSGTATITPKSARAGSGNNTIEVRYTAEGAMGGGAVSLQIPDGWGEMQADDAAAANHIAFRSSVKGIELNTDSLVTGLVIADLPGDADDPNAFKKGNSLTFVYGGAPGNEGAEAEEDIGLTTFTIQSDGDGDGGFGNLSSTTAAPAAPAMPVGKIYKGADGALKIEVTSGADGSGTAKVEIVGTSVGELRYDDDDAAFQIHAADDVQLKFTYTAGQRIQDGQLKLTIPRADGWTTPQDLTTGQEGYTAVNAPAGAIQQPKLTSSTVTVDIVDLAPDETIVINYGDGSSTVVAPSDIGPSTFQIAIKGFEKGEPRTP